MDSAEARMNYMKARQRPLAESSTRRTGRSPKKSSTKRSPAASRRSKPIWKRKRLTSLAVAGPRKEQIAQAHAQVAIQDATVERLKDQLTKHTIISRFDGYVTAEHTEVGQWVKQGDPVADVVGAR